jgi:small subunit ribosomal protein S11
MGKKKIADWSGDDTQQQETPVIPAKAAKKGLRRRVETGRIYIRSSYNNTQVTVTDDKGNVLAWASSGSTGFSGPKKATPFAASKVIASIAEKIDRTGPKKIDLYVSGIGPGRDSAVRSLAGYGFDITSVHDVTPLAHGGPRSAKQRRG